MRERWRMIAVLTGALFIASVSTVLGAHWLSTGGLSALEIVALALTFANLFWTASTAITALAGAVILWRKRPAAANGARSHARTRTALVFPVYNENFGDVAQTAEDLLAALTHSGDLAQFEFFFLSDSTAARSIELERRTMDELLGRHPFAPIFYRRRTVNTERKAGNIADFVTNWGGRYDFMVVFDADSVMTPHALTTLVERMVACPKTAIIQTVPKIINARSRYAHMQQFALNTYGPLYGAGIAWWSANGGNYWGHNAIIRVDAFARHAGLPVLPGKAPFGGPVLSHDFVEAALLRRAGWRLEMAPDIEGSYEQVPPTLIDAAARDRRWAQGNLQHLRLLFAPGFDWVSRIHFFCGIMSYLSSVFWFGLVLTGLAIALEAGPRPSPQSTPDLAGNALAGVVMLTLLAPKIAAIALWLGGKLSGAIRDARFIVSVVSETIISAAIAPIMMVNQTAAVVLALIGRDIGWSVQIRDRLSSDLREALRSFAPHKLAAVTLVAIVVPQSLTAGLWAAPTAVSLMASAFISHQLSKQSNQAGWLWRTLS
jgi:membrane glycosyltransferase